MDFINLNTPLNKLEPQKGRLLIAEPFLNDPNFIRSVVLISEHSEDGSVGFVLNTSTGLTLEDLLPDMAIPGLKIYQGGPVQVDTLHMIHRIPGILGGKEIAPGVYWGGSYEALQDAIVNNTCKNEDLRLFVGYSGWGPGQLETELQQGSWIVTEMSESVVFESSPDVAWKQAVRLLGKEYAFLENMPINPSLN